MISIQEHIALSSYSSFHLGGPARFFVSVRSLDELRDAIVWAQTRSLLWVVLGGASNVLIADKGFDGLVIKMEMTDMRIEGECLIAEAGVATAVAAAETARAGLTGFEWAAGVPGTIGGAVRGNAGAMGGEIKDCIERVVVLKADDQSEGQLVSLSCDECAFSYRESVFKKQPNWVVVEATFVLARGDVTASLAKIRECLAYRNRTQPKKYGSSGCGFKNIELADLTAEQIDRLRIADVPQSMFGCGRISAGWLIQHAGLAGVREGGAMISDVHGNFIVNTGTATATEVKRLIERVKAEVQSNFGVALEEEIMYI